MFERSLKGLADKTIKRHGNIERFLEDAAWYEEAEERSKQLCDVF